MMLEKQKSFIKVSLQRIIKPLNLCAAFAYYARYRSTNLRMPQHTSKVVFLLETFQKDRPQRYRSFLV